MRSFVITLALCSLFAIPLVHAKPRPPVLTACAAFAPDGSSAAATTDATNLILEITQPSGSVAQLNLGLRYTAPNWQLENQSMRWHLYTCQAFFNRDSNLVAVSVSVLDYTTFKHRLQIAVADLNSKKWIGDFTVEPQRAFVPLALAGFLEGSNSMVVTGALPGPAVDGTQHGSFASLLYDATGRQLVPMPATRAHLGPSDRTPARFCTDAVHDRLWGFPCVMYSTPLSKQPPCPVLSTTLVGEDTLRAQFNPRGYGTDRTELWMLPDTFAASDPNTVLIAESDTIWRIDIKKQNLERFVLPKRSHYPRFEGIHGPAALSPDGQVLAVPLVQQTVAFPYFLDNYVYKGTDIAVVRLHPFRLLGILPHGRAIYTPAFAVDHRQGKATILVYREDHWERHEFSCPPAS